MMPNQQYQITEGEYNMEYEAKVILMLTVCPEA